MTIEAGGTRLAVQAAAADGAERYPNFTKYRAGVTRELPVVVVCPMPQKSIRCNVSGTRNVAHDLPGCASRVRFARSTAGGITSPMPAQTRSVAAPS